jgi:hypothetical protein
MKMMSLILATACHTLMATRLLAQTSDRNAIAVALAGQLSISAERVPVSAQPTPHVVSRDPVKNGAIIGAVIGAVGFGVFAATLCHVYREEGGPSCMPDTLRFAAIGAAIGTGAGLAIDVARSRHPGVTVRVAVRF